MRLVNMHK